MFKYKIFILIPAVILIARGNSLADNEFECMIEPYEMVDLSSQVPGVLDKIIVEKV